MENNVPQTSAQAMTPPPSDKPFDITRIIAMLLVVAAFTAIGGYLGYWYGVNSTPATKQQSVVSKPVTTPTTPTDETATTPAPTTDDPEAVSDPVIESSVYTIPLLKEYNPSTFGRNLWVYTGDGTKSKRIISNHEIDSIFGFSPSKKRILVMTTSLLPSEKKVEHHLGFVTLENGQITKLLPGLNENGRITNAYWLNDNRILYSIGRKLEIYNISTGSTKVIVDTSKTIADTTSIRFKLSPNKQWVVYSYEYQGGGEGGPPQQDRNTYSLNLNNQEQRTVFTYPLGLYDLDNSSIIYTKESELRRINYDGTADILITNMPSGNLTELLTTNDGGRIIYKTKNYSGEAKGSQLHLFETASNRDSVLFRVVVPDGINLMQLPEAGDVVLFTVALDENQPIKFSLILYNYTSNKSIVLSDDVSK